MPVSSGTDDFVAIVFSPNFAAKTNEEHFYR
jgi:hypothetical protein